MSRARAAAARIPLDAYQTPSALAEAICDRLGRSFTPADIMEPSAGTGAFVRAARACWPFAHVTAVDLDPVYREALKAAGAKVVLVGQDWAELARQLANAQAEDGPERLVLGNPPFRHAQAHVEAALDWLRDGDRLALLLRINFLGSTDRVSFWRRPGLEWMAPIAPRPSFTGGGTDGTEYALFLWRKGFRGAPRIARPIVGPKGWKVPAAGTAA